MENTLKITESGERDLLITRSFNAPRTLVFEAMTRPELLRRWMLGPPGWEMTVCEQDLRPGGEFRCSWRGPDGQDMTMRGVFREITPPERIVRTECFDGCPAQAGDQLCTMTLDEANGRTTLTLIVRFASGESRDRALASGMEQGMAFGYERLDELLAATVSR